MSFGHLYISWKNGFSCFLFIFQLGLFVLMLTCMRALDILDINSLSDLSFANIFSCSVGWLFILLIVSLAVEEFFGLLYFHLFIFTFFLPEKTYQKYIAKTYVKDHTAYVFS